MVFPPFIMEQNGSLTGFSIELWNAIAARLKLKTSYQMMPDITAVEEAMRSKSVDLIVAPVFITSAREEVFDFSYPNWKQACRSWCGTPARVRGPQTPYGNCSVCCFPERP